MVEGIKLNMGSIVENLLPLTATVLEVVKRIEIIDTKIVLIVDDAQRLLGTVTDGDLRRGMLRGISLSAAVSEIMSAKPKTMPLSAHREEIQMTMQRERVRHMPLTDAEGRVTALESMRHLLTPRELDNWVVIMAGGRGMRLRPLTESTPKPMLEVGGRPVLESIVDIFVAQGFRKIFISVNHLAHKVMNHFEDDARYGAEIRYLEETEPLGNAGSLGLLPETPDKPLVVINGDILTGASFTDMLLFHDEHGAKATLAVRDYDFQIPFGVVEIDDYQITNVSEKPVKRYLVNAGIYVIDPLLLPMVPKNEPSTMPELFARAQRLGHPTYAFPIREDWMDIGRFEDLVRANDLAQS